MSDSSGESSRAWQFVEDRHDWSLWVPMDDGTGREKRYCQACGLMVTRREP